MFDFNTKLIATIVIIIIVGTLIFKGESQDIEVFRCNWSLNMEMKSFNGMLKEKYIDRSNHNKATLIISDNKMEYQITLVNEKNNIFEKLEIGDSINKSKGSLQIIAIRDKEEFVYQMDYGCRNL
ncbi:hypothetical protein [Algoriphagus chordae]|uniref:Uncharacterized protein n=1 Tax=Algoriphagus chordae TaxID=237019 RepID=A0A2W7QDL9_9BACT|nr:hypothetical protein [Algoriphagus chordae]PZX46321.1 hypothetical protein LV85_04342 [Algoriphagus chordae]